MSKYGFGFNNGGGGGGGGGSVSTQVGIVAFAAGGQTGATPLTAQECAISTASADGASVQLLAATVGNIQTITNGGDHIVSIYPINGGTDKFIGQAINAQLTIDPGGVLTVWCGVAGTYQYY